jgi:two-component system, chemotaxis family, protein-glutamate methylesterase/glutaminase
VLFQADQSKEAEMSSTALPSALVVGAPAGGVAALRALVAGPPAPRFRCRVGDAWTAESLVGGQSAASEGALWMALRSPEEKASPSRRTAVAARERGNAMAAARYDASGLGTERAGHLIGRLGGVIDVPHPDSAP